MLFPKSIPAHLIPNVLSEIAECDAFRAENPLPAEGEVRKWLEKEADHTTASLNMLGEPWLQSSGFSVADVDLLSYDLIKDLWGIGLQPFDKDKQLAVRSIGEQLNEVGGFKGMQLHYVVLQTIVTSSAFLGKEIRRPPGVFAFTGFVSKCWSGVGSWVD